MSEPAIRLDHSSAPDRAPQLDLDPQTEPATSGALQPMLAIAKKVREGSLGQKTAWVVTSSLFVVTSVWLLAPSDDPAAVLRPNAAVHPSLLRNIETIQRRVLPETPMTLEYGQSLEPALQEEKRAVHDNAEAMQDAPASNLVRDVPRLGTRSNPLGDARIASARYRPNAELPESEAGAQPDRAASPAVRQAPAPALVRPDTGRLVAAVMSGGVLQTGAYGQSVAPAAFGPRESSLTGIALLHGTQVRAVGIYDGETPPQVGREMAMAYHPLVVAGGFFGNEPKKLQLPKEPIPNIDPNRLQDPKNPLPPSHKTVEIPCLTAAGMSTCSPPEAPKTVVPPGRENEATMKILMNWGPDDIDGKPIDAYFFAANGRPCKSIDDGVMHQVSVPYDGFSHDDVNGATVGCSPLVFDLKGRGVRTVDQVARFDLSGVGRGYPIRDIAQDAGLLVFDADGDGIAGSDGREVFGNRTSLDGGTRPGRFADGFDALEAFIERAEREGVLASGAAKRGRLERDDLTKLGRAYGLGMRVGGMTAKTVTLEEAGIVEIRLSSATSILKHDFDGRGNAVARRAGAIFVRADGSVGDYSDVFFLPVETPSVAAKR